MRLVEKYRPRRLSDVVGQDKAIARLRDYMDDMGGRVWLFVGPSGTGKTTTTFCLANELGIMAEGETLQSIKKGRNLDFNFWAGSAMDKNAAAELADWAGYLPMRAPIKMAIIDEAQNITPGGRESLLSIFEGLTDNIVVVMTTTGLRTIAKQNDLFAVPKNDPFGSRCKHVHFVDPPAEAIIDHLVEIAFKETGNGAGLPYKEILEEGKGSIRACIDLLEDALKQLKRR